MITNPSHSIVCKFADINAALKTQQNREMLGAEINEQHVWYNWPHA